MMFSYYKKNNRKGMLVVSAVGAIIAIVFIFSLPDLFLFRNNSNRSPSQSKSHLLKPTECLKEYKSQEELMGAITRGGNSGDSKNNNNNRKKVTVVAFAAKWDGHYAAWATSGMYESLAREFCDDSDDSNVEIGFYHYSGGGYHDPESIPAELGVGDTLGSFEVHAFTTHDENGRYHLGEVDVRRIGGGPYGSDGHTKKVKDVIVDISNNIDNDDCDYDDDDDDDDIDRKMNDVVDKFEFVATIRVKRRSYDDGEEEGEGEIIGGRAINITNSGRFFRRRRCCRCCTRTADGSGENDDGCNYNCCRAALSEYMTSYPLFGGGGAFVPEAFCGRNITEPSYETTASGYVERGEDHYWSPPDLTPLANRRWTSFVLNDLGCRDFAQGGGEARIAASLEAYCQQQQQQQQQGLGAPAAGGDGVGDSKDAGSAKTMPAVNALAWVLLTGGIPITYYGPKDIPLPSPKLSSSSSSSSPDGGGRIIAEEERGGGLPPFVPPSITAVDNNTNSNDTTASSSFSSSSWTEAILRARKESGIGAGDLTIENATERSIVFTRQKPGADDDNDDLAWVFLNNYGTSYSDDDSETAAATRWGEEVVYCPGPPPLPNGSTWRNVLHLTTDANDDAVVIDDVGCYVSPDAAPKVLVVRR